MIYSPPNPTFSTVLSLNYIPNERSFYPLSNDMKQYNKLFFFVFFLWVTQFTHTYIMRISETKPLTVALEKQRSTLNRISFDSPCEALQNDVIRLN